MPATRPGAGREQLHGTSRGARRRDSQAGLSEPTPVGAAGDPIRSPERARRLARVLFSDIVAYAGDQIRIGLEKDDLLDRVAADIDRARLFYRQRVSADLPGAERIFEHALVDVLVGSQGRVSTHIW